jgi:hypothetical protein
MPKLFNTGCSNSSWNSHKFLSLCLAGQGDFSSNVEIVEFFHVVWFVWF